MADELVAPEAPVIPADAPLGADEFGEAITEDGLAPPPPKNEEYYLIDPEDEPDPDFGDEPEEAVAQEEKAESPVAVAEEEQSESADAGQGQKAAEKAKILDELIAGLQANPIDTLKAMLAQLPESVQKVFAQEVTGTATPTLSARDKIAALALDWTDENAIVTPADQFVNALQDDILDTMEKAEKIYSWVDTATAHVNSQGAALGAQAEKIAALEKQVAEMASQLANVQRPAKPQPAGLVNRGGASASREPDIDWSDPKQVRAQLLRARQKDLQAARR